MDVAAQVKTTDSTFIVNSRPIRFKVNKVNINNQERRWITDTLIPRLEALGDKGIIMGRAAASPEGPYANNRRLANQRKASVNELLGSYGINANRIRYDVVTEDYALLRSLMWLDHDSQYAAVDSLIEKYAGNSEQLKKAMMRHDGGKLWTHVLGNYFPKLRAVRIMAIDKSLVSLSTLPKNIGTLLDGQLIDPQNIKLENYRNIQMIDEPRREFLSLKTNLLYDFAYMPGYDRFCPIPNLAVEIYPFHGHFTYGASFEGPWWQHYDKHKYFQVRNYELFTRYYLRSGDILLRRPGEGAAFKGLYFSAYAHACIYNICFDAHRGWEGEGWGAGLGAGYVVPLGGKEHWRLEFGIQAGYFRSLYDPYQWQCPIDADKDKQLYYYKWYGNAKDFSKRKHRYSWIGPTRLEVTLSYDILYRRNHAKGVSFRNNEIIANY